MRLPEPVADVEHAGRHGERETHVQAGQREPVKAARFDRGQVPSRT